MRSTCKQNRTSRCALFRLASWGRFRRWSHGGTTLLGIIFVSVLVSTWCATLAAPASAAHCGDDGRTATDSSRPSQDYDPNNHLWNGLSEFMDIVSSAPLHARFVRSISSSDLKKTDVLFLLYPTRTLPVELLSAFVRRGGRLILADDFGRSDRFLHHLGISKIAIVDVPTEFRYLGRSQILYARRRSTKVLATRSDHVVTNHPKGLDGPGDVLYDIAGRPLVLSRTIGKGRVLILGDPSLFINNMLAFPSNRSFVQGITQWAAQGRRPVRVLVAARQFDIRAESRQIGGARGLLFRLRQLIQSASHAINALNLSADSLGVAAVLLAGLIFCLMAIRLPLRRIRYDGHWIRLGTASYHDGFASQFTTHANPNVTTYVEPACLIRNRLDDFLERRLHVTSPLTLLSGRQVERMLALHFERAAARLFSRMQHLLCRLPLSLEPGGPPAPRFSFRNLARLDRWSMALMSAIQAHDRPRNVARNRAG